MREGAFAFLDCLGFKGVWNREVEPQRIVEYLQRAKRNSERLATKEFAKRYLGENVETAVAFISDTVVVSVQPRSDLQLNDSQRGFLVQLAAYTCIEIIRIFANCPKPLAMRGCIAYGPHLVADSFFVGPAVDEAAEGAEISQGAFVWLTRGAGDCWIKFNKQAAGTLRNNLKSAPAEKLVGMLDSIFEASGLFAGLGVHPGFSNYLKWWKELNPNQKSSAAPIFLKIFDRPLLSNEVVSEYPMPLRSAHQLRVPVLNPFLSLPEDYANRLESLILGTFDKDAIDVRIKQQNTKAFIRWVREWMTSRQTDPKLVAEQNAELEAATGVKLPALFPPAKLREDWREVMKAEQEDKL